MSTNQTPPRPVVHLELHTPDQVRASAFYAEAAVLAPGGGPSGTARLLLGARHGWAPGRRDRRMRHAAAALGALRRGRPGRPVDRARPRARSDRAARTAGGAVGLAQRRLESGSRGGRALGAEAMSDERQLLEAAQAGDEKAFALPRRALTRPRFARTATGCSAQSPTPRTRCRRRCSAPGADSHASRVEARFAPGSSDRHQRQPAYDREAAQARATDRLRAELPAHPHVALDEPLTESIWLEPYPDGELGVEAALLGRTRATNSATEHRARLRRRYRTPPRPATCRLDPPRRAGLLRPGDRRGARDHPRLGRQRATESPQGDRRNAVPAQTQQADAAARSATAGAPARSSNASPHAWKRNDVDAVVAMLAR